jgi:CBS domain-containing protein
LAMELTDQNPESASSRTAASVKDAMIKEPKTCLASATVGDVRRFFEDDHVHAALLVQGDLLVAVVERGDVQLPMSESENAAAAGRLKGRVVLPDACLADVFNAMQTTGRRRLAVIDRRGALMGLLCLKNSGRGFCSDADVRARETERRTAEMTQTCVTS